MHFWWHWIWKCVACTLNNTWLSLIPKQCFACMWQANVAHQNVPNQKSNLLSALHLSCMWQKWMVLFLCKHMSKFENHWKLHQKWKLCYCQFLHCFNFVSELWHFSCAKDSLQIDDSWNCGHGICSTEMIMAKDCNVKICCVSALPLKSHLALHFLAFPLQFWIWIWWSVRRNLFCFTVKGVNQITHLANFTAVGHITFWLLWKWGWFEFPLKLKENAKNQPRPELAATVWPNGSRFVDSMKIVANQFNKLCACAVYEWQCLAITHTISKKEAVFLAGKIHTFSAWFGLLVDDGLSSLGVQKFSVDVMVCSRTITRFAKLPITTIAIVLLLTVINRTWVGLKPLEQALTVSA